jgi:prenyltransferase beta subunit
MRRILTIPLLLFAVLPAVAQTPTPAEKKATIAFLHSLQKENGGFAADLKPDTPASLPATSSAIRALKYFGSEVKNKDDCAKFVVSCYDSATGAFSPLPAGKSDVRTTAVGAMAIIELRELKAEGDVIKNVAMLSRTPEYFTSQAKTFEEVRIGAAAFEALKLKLAPGSVRTRWLDTLTANRNADGTYGKGDGVARDTGSVAAALLRLGAEVEQRDNVIRALKAGQRPDGGWGKEGEKSSDFESSYRVIRALYMLKEKPDAAACQAFVAKCRQADGSYAVQPGQPGSLSGTYYAGIILHWLAGLSK